MMKSELEIKRTINFADIKEYHSFGYKPSTTIKEIFNYRTKYVREYSKCWNISTTVKFHLKENFTF